MPSPRDRRLIAGAATVVLLYGAAVALSLTTAHHRVRPLYEGFVPAAPYQWINPPPAFAAGNVPPPPASEVTDFKSTGVFGPVGLTGSASQVILNLPAGAIAASPGDKSVKTTITTLDPATLGPTTSTGLVPDGNAVRFDFVYQPSGRTITKLARFGQLILAVPMAGHRVLYSPDGRRWTPAITQQMGQSSFLITDFTATGYYLAASRNAAAKPPAGSGSSNVGPIAAAAAALAVVLVLGPLVWLRRKRRTQGGQG